MAAIIRLAEIQGVIRYHAGKHIPKMRGTRH